MTFRHIRLVFRLLANLSECFGAATSHKIGRSDETAPRPQTLRSCDQCLEHVIQNLVPRLETGYETSISFTCTCMKHYVEELSFQGIVFCEERTGR